MKQSELIFKTVWRQNKKFAALFLFCCFVFSINCGRTDTEGWTTYRQNNARSGDFASIFFILKRSSENKSRIDGHQHTN